MSLSNTAQREIKATMGVVDCNKWPWPLIQPAGLVRPVSCDPSLGDNGSFTVSTDDLLAAVNGFGIEDPHTIIWVQAWAPNGNGYAQTTTRLAELDATAFEYEVGNAATVRAVTDAAMTTLADAGVGNTGTAIARTEYPWGPRDDVQGSGPDGSSFALAPTATDQTAPMSEAPARPGQGTGGAVRVTFNPSSSEIYPVTVSVTFPNEFIYVYDGDKLVGKIGGYDGAGGYLPTTMIVSSGSQSRILVRNNATEQSGNGIQLIPRTLGKTAYPFDKFEWSGDIDEIYPDGLRYTGNPYWSAWVEVSAPDRTANFGFNPTDEGWTTNVTSVSIDYDGMGSFSTNEKFSAYWFYNHTEYAISALEFEVDRTGNIVGGKATGTVTYQEPAYTRYQKAWMPTGQLDLETGDLSITLHDQSGNPKLNPSFELTNN